MTPTLCALFADYNRSMNLRLYEAAAKLPADELTKDRGAFFGSLLSTMNHIAVADLLWLHRFATLPEMSAIRAQLANSPRPTSLREPLVATLEELMVLRANIDAVVSQLASLINAELLARTLRYTNMAGAHDHGNSTHDHGNSLDARL